MAAAAQPSPEGPARCWHAHSEDGCRSKHAADNKGKLCWPCAEELFGEQWQLGEKMSLIAKQRGITMLPPTSDLEKDMHRTGEGLHPWRAVCWAINLPDPAKACGGACA